MTVYHSRTILDGLAFPEAPSWRAGRLWFTDQHARAILDRCTTRGIPYACMLGGEDCRTLYICTSETDDPQEAAKQKSGRIDQVRVAVAGAGLP